jgi:5'-nucleotidase
MADKIFLWDLDGSLADYVGRLVQNLESMRGPGDPIITAENIWTCCDQFPYIRARMDSIKAQNNWWFNLPEIANGMRVFRECQRIGFHNMVLSKAPKRCPEAYTEKCKWSLGHLDENIDVQVTSGSKGIVFGRGLYDDSIEFARDWLVHRPRGIVIMPDTPYNQGFTHPQVLRWTGENWDEVVKALVACYERADEPSH